MTSNDGEPGSERRSGLERREGQDFGYAVVGADVGGQAALLKEPLKHGKRVVFPSGSKYHDIRFLDTLPSEV
jgi:hypothetical protein